MKKREVQSEKSFFSIIMPIYNAEKFLQKAVHSILAQTFSNFELLLICLLYTSDAADEP